VRIVALMAAVFHLAPMTRELRVLTWLLIVLPAVLLYGALSAPFPVGASLFATTAFMVLVYASVWFGFRPTRFEVDAHALRIVWPLRSRVIDRADIESARIVTASEFRSEYGYGMRIGAGGLWGGFGLLKTSRETFSMWISRTDRFVIVQLRGARPLLVTPTLPERFVEVVTASVRP
jgi:hypothetical protein